MTEKDNNKKMEDYKKAIKNMNDAMMDTLTPIINDVAEKIRNLKRDLSNDIKLIQDRMEDNDN